MIVDNCNPIYTNPLLSFMGGHGMTNDEIVKILDEDLKYLLSLSKKEAEKYIDKLENYDPIWDDLFNINWGLNIFKLKIF